ncbi:hypothetical protein IKF73_00235 [Candidatus Saccharibacteria bacterium]|nr:hypothetical protein [Candidatus Saccharibacteria bacterium]
MAYWAVFTDENLKSKYHFRIIDKVASSKNLSYLDALKAILPFFRYDKWARREVDAPWILDKIFGELPENAKNSSDTKSFFHSNEAKEEVESLSATLDKLAFFKDSPAKIACLTSLFSEEYDIVRRSEPPYNDIYTALKERKYYEYDSFSEISLKLIFEAFKANLSPDQYTIICFYISELYYSIADASILTKKNYVFTESEWQLIKAAIQNIRNSTKIKEAINKAVVGCNF